MILNFLLSLLLIEAYLFANIDKKIISSKHELARNETKLKKLNKKLYTIAINIKREKNSLKNIDSSLAKLEKDLNESLKDYQKNVEDLKELQEKEKKLQKSSESLKEEMTLLVAKYFSKSLAAQNLKLENKEDIVNEEILNAVKKSQKNKILNVNNMYLSVENRLKSVKTKIKQLQDKINALDKKREEFIKLKKRKEKTLLSYVKRKREYKESIENLLEEQKSLRETIERLKILQSSQKNVHAKASKVKVRKLGKSYQYVKTIKYRGPKTIPPLKSFVITKRYGEYVDPIYKIKIFNESIELKPLKPNEKVRSILNGKVVLAKRTPHLNNVVIIKHRGNLYTIYANIDKIAPTIKKGKVVRKGYVIGRVNRKLTFEVTKNRYHINPLDLIKID